MKALLMTLIAAAAALSFDAADAHGSTKPAHGGVVQMVGGETVVELVSLDNGADVYLKEEGEELDTAKMTGKLTITSDGATSEVQLAPAGGNKLSAKGVKLTSGAKVAVLVTRADQSKIGTTFTIK